ncbi:MAG: hypothetical protein WCC60_16950 [Ilumatobacteraceae bacterium]
MATAVASLVLISCTERSSWTDGEVREASETLATILSATSAAIAGQADATTTFRVTGCGTPEVTQVAGGTTIRTDIGRDEVFESVAQAWSELGLSVDDAQTRSDTMVAAGDAFHIRLSDRRDGKYVVLLGTDCR